MTVMGVNVWKIHTYRDASGASRSFNGLRSGNWANGVWVDDSIDTKELEMEENGLSPSPPPPLHPSHAEAISDTLL